LCFVVSHRGFIGELNDLIYWWICFDVLSVALVCC